MVVLSSALATLLSDNSGRVLQLSGNSSLSVTKGLKYCVI